MSDPATTAATGVRPARPGDGPLLLSFIRMLAAYEHLEHEVVATPADLEKWIMQEHKAEALFALDAGGREVGFALYFTSYSTFAGRPGIYLEDLFVLPECRARGHGTRLLDELARITIERGYARLEWSCLNWNHSSLDFYRSWGATPMEEWIRLRIGDEDLARRQP